MRKGRNRSSGGKKKKRVKSRQPRRSKSQLSRCLRLLGLDRCCLIHRLTQRRSLFFRCFLLAAAAW